jgi:hypothetical protein
MVVYPGWQYTEIYYNREFLYIDFHGCQMRVVPYCEVLYSESTVNYCYVTKLRKRKVPWREGSLAGDPEAYL